MGQLWCGTPLHHHGHTHCFGRLAQMVRALMYRKIPEVVSSSLAGSFAMCYVGEFPSGQRGQTVNLLLLASMVQIHPLPPAVGFLSLVLLTVLS